MAQVNKELHEVHINITDDDVLALAATGKNLEDLLTVAEVETKKFCGERTLTGGDNEPGCGIGTIHRKDSDGVSVGFMCTTPELIDQTARSDEKMQCVKFAASLLVSTINQTVVEQRPFRD